MIGVKLTFGNKTYKIGLPDSETSLVVTQVNDYIIVEGFAYFRFKVGIDFDIEIEEMDHASPIISNEEYNQNCDCQSDFIVDNESERKLNRYKELQRVLTHEGLL